MKGHIMRIGYLRVQDNSESKNVHTEIVEKLNVEKAFVEKTDQENDESPQLMKALEYLRTGDVFVVKEFAEIASSMAELLSIVRKLAQKQIGFVSLKEKIDTSLPGGGAVMNVFTARRPRISNCFRIKAGWCRIARKTIISMRRQ